MKFQRFKWYVSYNMLFILPTIILFNNDAFIYNHNFSIEFHWLGFHCKWFWMEED